VLLLYLEQAIAATRNEGLALTSDMLVEGIREDAVLRVRPKAMTVAVIVARRLR
jgi:Cu/Ag efflux pump CusA